MVFLLPEEHVALRKLSLCLHDTILNGLLCITIGLELGITGMGTTNWCMFVWVFLTRYLSLCRWSPSELHRKFHRTATRTV